MIENFYESPYDVDSSCKCANKYDCLHTHSISLMSFCCKIKDSFRDEVTSLKTGVRVSYVTDISDIMHICNIRYITDITNITLFSPRLPACSVNCIKICGKSIFTDI